MVRGKIVHGLNCPQCGGTLEIEEGQTIVNCPYCGVSSLLTGEKGMWRFQVHRAVEREKALQVVRSFFAGYNKAPDLQRQAIIEECFPVYVPYWRAWARMAAWLFGRRRGEDSTYPVEKAITDDYVWTDVACDLSEFGLQSIDVKEGDLELYNREALQREALVFDPVESNTEAMNRAKEEFLERARRKASLSETRFERFQFLREKLSLVYYPLWVVRYLYQGRSYQVVVDGVRGRVLYGRAPGDPFLRAVAFVLAWLVAVTLPVDAMMLFGLLLSNSEIPPDLGTRLALLVPLILNLLLYSMVFYVLPTSISLALISAGYSLLRFGGERAVGEKRMFQDFWHNIFGGQWITRLGCAAWSCGLVASIPLSLLSFVLQIPSQFVIPGLILATFVGLYLGWRWAEALPSTKDEPSSVEGAEIPGWLQELRAAAKDDSFQGERRQAPTTIPDSELSLLPLRCPNCQTPVPAREGEVAYLCQNCGQGLELTAEGLRQVEISFAAPQPQPYLGRRGTSYLPFWVFEGEVQVRKREAVKGVFGVLGVDNHGEMRGQPRRFYVPAFETPLRELQWQWWGVDLTRRQSHYPPGEKGELKGCVYNQEEARKLAEFIFLSIEARKPDVLQEIDYDLKLTAPRLLVVPFVGAERKGPSLRLGQMELSSLAQWWQTADRKKVVMSIILLIGLGYMVCTCSRFAFLGLIFLRMLIESILGL